MAKDFLEEFIPDLDEFREKTMAFHNKEITVPEYKGFSGGYGSYAQRGGEKHMLRLRLAGGQVTKDKLKFIADLCEKYNVDLIKMTTCQSLQLHNLEAEDLCGMIESVWRAGMVSRGGGGDFPRNVMASSLSGVQAGENFDVLPYAKEMADYLMNFIKSVKFPRKLKVCFSNSEINETHATFRDMGFVSRTDGKFDVYIAGGLGNKHKLGVKVAEAVEPCKVLYYAKAMVDTFVEYGNYTNRAQSRTRFLQDTLGTDGLKKAFNEKLDKVFESEMLDINVEPYIVNKKDDGVRVSGNRITAQKQTGLYAVFYQPVGGKIAPSKLREIYDVIKDMEDVEIRITPEESLYIINCNGSEAEKVLEVTQDGASNLFETSVACIGSQICQVGIGNSQELLNMCIDAVRKENFADGVLPQIHISGCPSSCAAQQIAEIGFRGAMKQSQDGPRKAFAIYIGGCPYQGKENLSDFGKSITVEAIPKFLVELGKTVSGQNTTYNKWIVNNRQKLDELVEKYAEM
ncbi:MAG: nitrite/sulfite reductase [Lachnospiraceae bacterium]|jgi:Sulfite reductase, beta subunit (hemoprotein)